MIQDKKEMSKDPSIMNQEALVKRLLGPKTNTHSHIIPGGKSLFSQVDKRTLNDAIYTWLRAVRSFSEVTISFVGDSSKMKLKETSGEEFTNLGTSPIWEVAGFGRQYLAKKLSDVIIADKIVKIRATKAGITYWTDATNKFSYSRKPTATEIAAGTHPDERVVLDEFVPMIEFKLSNRSQY